MKNSKIYFGAFALAVIAALSVGCSRKEPAEAVKERAAERWNLLITHQPVKAYDYLSPGYRTTHTLEQYVAFVATARLRWLAAKVQSVRCDEEACTTKVQVTSSIPGQLVHMPQDIEQQTIVIERWLESDGQWYFLPDAGITPSALTPKPAQDESKAVPPGTQTAPGLPRGPDSPTGSPPPGLAPPSGLPPGLTPPAGATPPGSPPPGAAPPPAAPANNPPAKPPAGGDNK